MTEKIHNGRCFQLSNVVNLQIRGIIIIIIILERKFSKITLG